MNKINIEQKLSLITDHWNPRVIAELNGQQVKIAKFQGEFIWHKHDSEDELFMVIKGSFEMQFKSHSVVLSEGEILIIPRGTEHRPVAEHEVQVLLFEPASTLNTGDVQNERTIENPQKI